MTKKRNLKIDAKFCEAINDYKIEVSTDDCGNTRFESELTVEELALFIREAIEGWPIAIQRALSAEGGVKALSKEVAKLRKENKRLVWLLDQLRGSGADE